MVSKNEYWLVNCSGVTLPVKNVFLAEWFNSVKEKADDEDIKSALHARI